MMISKQSTQNVQCPYCELHQVKRDGCTIKGAQRFYCYNCRRYWQDGYIRVAKTEAFDEQKELFAWAQNHPVLMHHLLAIVDNLNRRTKKPNPQFKTQGCDVLLAYPVKSYHGLWIKLKQYQEVKTDTQETEQSWIQAMKAVSYEVKVAYGWKQAVKEIENYLAWKH